METIFERAGALDVHKAQVTGCVRVPDADGQREPHLAEFTTTVAGRTVRCGDMSPNGASDLTEHAAYHAV